MKKRKNEIWFGCRACGYRPERDESMSNKNWNVYTPGPCPKCRADMRINYGEYGQAIKKAGEGK